MRTTLLRILLPFLLSAVSYADPIVLQATFVHAGVCGFAVQGADFSFEDNFNGPCQDRFVGSQPPFEYRAGIYIFAPAYGQAVGYPGPKLATGTISLFENPGRIAVLTGSVIGPVLSLPIPLDPFPAVSERSLEVSENTFLIGSLSACLLPFGAQGGPCDPAYGNFATINLHVTGSYLVDVNYFSGGTYVGTFDRGFTGTSAAVPEPSTLAFLFIGSLSAMFVAGRPLVRGLVDR